MGGGWCNDEASCLSRSKILLGSSKPWTPQLSKLWAPMYAGFYGLMDANETNPFGDWNFVWPAYCDGTSQTSDRTEPHVVGGGKDGGEPTVLHFRGRALLDAHLHDLELDHQFLSTATEVIISGTSAGGMSTYVQSSFIKSQLKQPHARLVAAPDAGWWWDHAAYGNASKRPWLDSMTKSIGPELWNATLRGTGAHCLADPPHGDKAYCYTQPYSYSFLDVPAFVVQSLADPANLGACYAMPCSLDGSEAGSCSPKEVAAIGAYGEELKTSILTAQAREETTPFLAPFFCLTDSDETRAINYQDRLVTNNGKTGEKVRVVSEQSAT
jgi:hypothetical protein